MTVYELMNDAIDARLQRLVSILIDKMGLSVETQLPEEVVRGIVPLLTSDPEQQKTLSEGWKDLRDILQIEAGWLSDVGPDGNLKPELVAQVQTQISIDELRTLWEAD